VVAGSVKKNSFAVRDNATGVFIGGQSYTISGDGTLVNFVAPGPLATGHSYTVFFSQFQGLTDYAGNAAAITQFGFTTSFTPDTTIPQVVGVSPPDTTAQAPLNTQVVIAFNEPVQGSSIGQVTLSSSGGQVGVLRTLSNGNRTLTLTPVNPLSVNTTYTVRVAGVQDLGSNTLIAPVTTSFSTGTEADLIRPSVVVVDPANNAVGVGTNAVVRVQFSERVNAISVNSGTLQMTRSTDGVFLAPTSITVAGDGMSAVWSGPLAASTGYRISWVNNGITDLAGQGINGGSSVFTTAQGVDTAAPLLVATSPGNGTTGVAVNARVIVQFNEAMETVGIGQPFVVTGGGTTVTGSVSASADRTALIFTPASLLAPSTVYTATVAGLKDVAGNAAATVTFSFTTGATGVADTTRPSVISVSPASGSTNVATTSVIVWTFNEPIDATSVNTNSVLVRNNTTGASIAGSFTVNGAVLTFTPAGPLPGNTLIVIQINLNTQVLDLAGNQANTFGGSFTTGAQ